MRALTSRYAFLSRAGRVIQNHRSGLDSGNGLDQKALPHLSHLVEQNAISCRPIHVGTTAQGRFFERHPKGIYHDPSIEEENKQKIKQNLYGLRTGFKEIRTEIVKWKDEMKQQLTDDHKIFIVPGDKDYVWTFNSPESLNDWFALSDYDHNEGYSRCKLSISQTGKGLFQGFVNLEAPFDGKIKNAGYCGMKCKRIMKSFRRESYLDWSEYNALIMRIRGDGRSYIINISTAGYYDITWSDVYHYVLYTRGGPYWQNVKIPFSKFMVASKGRVQDNQEAIPRFRIASFGLAAGRVEGPFNLEIDYIGVEFDGKLNEEFAYEQYRVPSFISGV